MQASPTVADTFVSSPNDLCHADFSFMSHTFAVRERIIALWSCNTHRHNSTKYCGFTLNDPLFRTTFLYVRYTRTS